MTLQLYFHRTHSFNYPSPSLGGATAMTLCKANGDTFLAFIAQQPDDDRLLLCDTCEGNIQIEHATPAGRPEIGGMGFSLFDNLLYCGNGTDTREFVTAIDPVDGSVVQDFELSNPGTRDASAFATNGIFMMRGDGEVLELLTMSGVKLGERTYPGRLVRGVSASPNSWTVLDGINNEIVVIGPLGQEIAVATAPGPTATSTLGLGIISGPHAIAFDYVNWPYNASQLCIPSAGMPDNVLEKYGSFENSPYFAGNDWDPVPWHFKHRIYVANQTTNTVYAGYLTEEAP